MIAYLLRQLTKRNILWFVLDLWPLKNPCTNMDPNLFLQKCKQQYWDKLNESKTLWVLVGAGSSKHINSAYRTAWTFIWPLIYRALALRKCLENFKKYRANRIQTFFSVCCFGAMVCVPFPTFFFFSVFRRWYTKLMNRENGTKWKIFDLWPKFTSCANEGPPSLHLQLLLSS